MMPLKAKSSKCAPEVSAGVLESSSLQPLFPAWAAPDKHRAKSKDGGPAEVVNRRRPSRLPYVNPLRAAVADWRAAFYAGASATTRHLLDYWFERQHRVTTSAGEEVEFRYHFCQREAIETLIYLYEVRGINRLSQIVAEFGGPGSEAAAKGITDEEDAWARYAFKMATGSGKTKVMSLAIAWSYFHALREPDSLLARHFVIIAPNLTVYERLKEDFGNGAIFDSDPVIPQEWRGEWNLSVVLQDEAGGAVTGGSLYLTNVHRLYDPAKRRTSGEGDMPRFMGPPVQRAKALDTGEALRERITAHRRVMVLNDEAHHVWDPDSAWSEAIRYLNDALCHSGGADGGLVAQLDFSATPKDNGGRYFKHIICDSPLGEAVDAGIVKTPVLGVAKERLSTQPNSNHAYKFEQHLLLGYERWKASRAEWKKSGKKALLFVMCEDTEAADQITQRLNTDALFEKLNEKTINLHTNLKGKVKRIGKGTEARVEFVPDEKGISDDDLKALRKLSRELDSNASPYECIVSVLMLREGWDVRNVTTIIPLRPYSSVANILPEQTLGRGLRRITPPGQAAEVLTVVEHSAFVDMYREELEQEGLAIDVVDVERQQATTISIFPDSKKDLDALEIAVPVLTPGIRVAPRVENLKFADVQRAAAKYGQLPLGKTQPKELEYEGRQLITQEVVERFKINLPLLSLGVPGAVTYYVKQLEEICRLRGLHQTVAPLLEKYLCDLLFVMPLAEDDPRLTERLGEPDVGEHVRAVFVPLIRERITQPQDRSDTAQWMKLSEWKPYQATFTDQRPALKSDRTLFNLVPCNLSLEVAMTKFLGLASDVVAFAKNAGPQCLRIDYLAQGRRLAFYTPDFFVRTKDGKCALIETKGREDQDVAAKARAAIEWCKSASNLSGVSWDYIYASQRAFGEFTGTALSTLREACKPTLRDLLSRGAEEQEELPLFAGGGEAAVVEPQAEDRLFDPALLENLPERTREAVEQATELMELFAGNKKLQRNYAPVFNALLGAMDNGVRAVLSSRLAPELPEGAREQSSWFMLSGRKSEHDHVTQLCLQLRKGLVYGTWISPLGILRNCLDYALNDGRRLGGVLTALVDNFTFKGATELIETVRAVNDFRNKYVAHQEKELRDADLAREQFGMWVGALAKLTLHASR